jgi:hypothetical protein
VVAEKLDGRRSGTTGCNQYEAAERGGRARQRYGWSKVFVAQAGRIWLVKMCCKVRLTMLLGSHGALGGCWAGWTGVGGVVL